MAKKKQAKKPSKTAQKSFSLPENPTIHVHPFLRDFPTSLKLGIHTIKVRLSLSPQHNADLYGQYDSNSDTITLSAIGALNTPEKAFEVAVHEYLHAVDTHNQLHIPKDAPSIERTVTVHGIGVAQLFTQNPELIAWMKKYLTSHRLTNVSGK